MSPTKRLFWLETLPNVAFKLVLILLYAVLIFFSVGFSLHIWHQYLLGSWESDWVALLPNLNELWYPAFGMFIHWCGGFVILVVGLVQILPITRKHMLLHRCLGTIYVAAALVTSLGGNLFIYTTSKHLVGGRNMDIAFSTAGWIMFILAVMTYYHARAHDHVRHRDYAIRLWGQGIASLCYRFWYNVVAALGYAGPTQLADFHRPLDEILDWWFFVPNLLLTEAIVWHIHHRDSKRSQCASRTAEADLQDREALIGDEIQEVGEPAGAASATRVEVF